MTDTLPTLIVTGGPFDGSTLALERPSAQKTLGSGPDCALRLQLGNVAPLHARLSWDARGLVISDAGSTSGTYVNGERISDEQVLAEGDRVFLGPPGSKESVKLLALRVPPASETAPEAGAVLLEAEPEPFVLDSVEDAGAPPAIILEHPSMGPPPTTPAPAPASTPAPSAAPPAVGAKPAVSKPAAPGEARKPARPEYTTDMPSMAPADRVREAVALPPVETEAPKPKRKLALPSVTLPRPVLVGAATILVAGGALFAYRAFQQPPPVLNSVTPPRVEPGQTVTLTGSGFDPRPEKNAVRFGDGQGQVTSASDTQISVAVPANIPVGERQVKVLRRGTPSNVLFLEIYQAPRVTALEPDVAMPGTEVVAKGQHLEGKPVTVLVGNLTAEVVESQAAALRFRVPGEVPLGKTVPVDVKVGAYSARPASLVVGRLPLVLEAVPPRAMAGERVVLKGRGFDPSPAGNAVTFGGHRALVLTSSEAELTVAAPGGGTSETQVEAPVVVQARGATSSAYPFVVVRPSTGVFAPRYFPAPVVEHPDHDHVFVSTELGPVLLLTGKAKAPSTAERATRVAAALNALAGSGKPVTVELREKPEPAVAVAGATEVLASASAEDAAGYDEPWGPAAKGRRSTPRAVASYWTALLQDHLLLFFQHERPYHVLEVSPRGKVLRDLYAESLRRAGPGQGVPTSLVSRLSPTVEREMRDLALLLPAEGQAAAGPAPGAAVVEGRWAGTMQESGFGEKRITVRLRVEGARLAGSLTTQAGKIAMDVPLNDLAYEKGTLRFSVLLGGAPRRFVGTVEGESMNGAIHAGEAREPKGRFSLKYVE